MPDVSSDIAKIITVADGFCVRQAVDNMAWIDMGEWALAVDALEQPELEQEVFQAIGKTLGRKPIRYLLNTHTHQDHVALNDAFRRRGAEIVNAKIVKIPEDGRRFDGGRRSALMLPMGGCHTVEDCVIHLPSERALFVGDLFGWGLIPCGRLDDTMAHRLLATYERMIEFGAAVVIPGHGPLCTTAELMRWTEYFGWLLEEVTQRCRRSTDDDEVAAGIPPPDDMAEWWRFLDWKHADSVDKVIQAVRSGRMT